MELIEQAQTCAPNGKRRVALVRGSAKFTGGTETSRNGDTATSGSGLTVPKKVEHIC